MAFVSNPSSSDDNSTRTDLSDINMEDEKQIDMTTWTSAKRKKSQHMTEFHEEYQQVFGEKASLCMIMKQRISHMNPPMPDSVCKEEMQSATIENDVIIEYMTDAQGRKVKKLKQHIHSDDNLPNVPKENFVQRREVTVDSYSETISSDSSSDDRTITADPEESTSSMEDKIEDNTCGKETDTTDIEASLYHIASGLQNAAEGYMSLKSHISKLNPYELPQVIAQIPPPPTDVPMPIRKALLIDGESKTVNHLLRGEYKMTNTSWSKLQKKYSLSKSKNEV